MSTRQMNLSEQCSQTPELRKMPKVSEICRHVRSKNAGLFWITLDLFFRDRASFDRYVEAPQFQPAAIGSLFDVDSGLVKRFVIPDLLAIKLSYPRRHPQGGALERDMHGGQQYVRVLDMECLKSPLTGLLA